MDITQLLVRLLPASVLPYVKAVVTVVGGASSAVLAVYPGVATLHWYVILSAAVTALGVYFLPNVKVATGTATTGPAAKPADDGAPTAVDDEVVATAPPVTPAA